jgi:hypothetical protein
VKTFFWNLSGVAITQINSISISLSWSTSVCPPWALNSFFCHFKFLFAIQESSSSISICQWPMGSNMLLFHLLHQHRCGGSPPLCWNHIILGYFKHLPPAVQAALKSPSLFCPVSLPNDLTVLALCHGEKFGSHTPILNSSSVTFWLKPHGTFGNFMTFFSLPFQRGIMHVSIVMLTFEHGLMTGKTRWKVENHGIISEIS